jgi:hypothetical protein
LEAIVLHAKVHANLARRSALVFLNRSGMKSLMLTTRLPDVTKDRLRQKQLEQPPALAVKTTAASVHHLSTATVNVHLVAPLQEKWRAFCD